MHEQQELTALVNAANADLNDPARTRVMRAQPGDTPRFELYHAGLSMCSQKVRAVLAEKGVPYVSHEMTIVASRGIWSADFRPAENYRPSYVRLRLYGGRLLDSPFAQTHTGRSSFETEGFDPCVVPLLVDHQAGQSIIDSMRICAHLDRELPQPPRLIPAEPDAAAAVLRQAAIVDRTPHPAVLYGFHPDDDQRPDFIKAVMQEVYEAKCEQLEMLIAANRDEAELVSAYESKIAKEQAGRRLARDHDFQRRIRAELERIIATLDNDLGRQSGAWLCGADYSLADLMWGISLYRLQWLGLAKLWQNRPLVRAYADRVYRRPSVWEDVIHWPSPMPPSPHTADVV